MLFDALRGPFFGVHHVNQYTNKIIADDYNFALAAQSVSVLPDFTIGSGQGVGYNGCYLFAVPSRGLRLGTPLIPRLVLLVPALTAGNDVSILAMSVDSDKRTFLDPSSILGTSTKIKGQS